jgi:hypothetical protein
MFKKIGDAMHVVVLKAEARRLYLTIHNRSVGLDCGARLAEHIRPDIGKARIRFNKVMAELATLDPEAKTLFEKDVKVVR